MNTPELLQYITKQLHYTVQEVDNCYQVMYGDDYYGYRVMHNYHDGSGAAYIFDNELDAWKQVIDIILDELEGC